MVPLNLKEAPWLSSGRPDGSKTITTAAKKAYVSLFMTVPHQTPPVKRSHCAISCTCLRYTARKLIPSFSNRPALRLAATGIRYSGIPGTPYLIHETDEGGVTVYLWLDWSGAKIVANVLRLDRNPFVYFRRLKDKVKQRRRKHGRDDRRTGKEI